MMCLKNRKLTLIVLFIVLCCLINCISSTIYATEGYNEVQIEISDNEPLINNIDLTPIIGNPISDISIPTRVSFNNENVLSYSIETEGLTATEVSSGSMEFDILATDEYGTLDIYATYVDDVVVKSSVYTYLNGNTVYLSEYSHKNALEKYLECAVEDNIYTLEEAEQIWSGFSFEVAEDEIVDEILEPTSVNANQGIASCLFEDRQGVICGTIEWKDDKGIVHPLQRVQVAVYKKVLGINWRIAITYTDNTGFFSISIPENEDVFIGVWAGTENVMVRTPYLGFAYKVVFDEYLYDVSSDSHTTVDLPPIDMSTEEGQAIQIAQAALIARDYAWIMMNEIPSDVIIAYPSSADNCYYSPLENKIRIIKKNSNSTYYPNFYASWDAIMHEYGHHIQKNLDINDSFGDGHSSTLNIADHYKNHYINNDFIDCDIDCILKKNYLNLPSIIVPEDKCKYTGDILAWGESWPTVFALLAQNYYAHHLVNIDTVADTSYTAYNRLNYNIENASVYKGEACERSIMAVLWDLFDSGYEESDQIVLGHQAFWNISTIAGTYTFSDFMENFYAEYPQHRYNIASNLTKYNMATSEPTISSTGVISVNNPITVNWMAQGGSINYPNNRFSIVVYKNGVEIFIKNNIVNNFYTFTLSEWQTLLSDCEYTCGEELDIAIVAYQDDGESYITGPYYSSLVTFSIDHNCRCEVINETYHAYMCNYCGQEVSQKTHNFECDGVENGLHYEKCVDCEYRVNQFTIFEHTNITSAQHTKICDDCGYSETYHHVNEYEKIDSSNHKQYCIECGYIKKTEAHNYTYSYTPTFRNRHMKACICGDNVLEECIGMTYVGGGTYCMTCGQQMTNTIIPFNVDDEEEALPLIKKEDEEY